MRRPAGEFKLLTSCPDGFPVTLATESEQPPRRIECEILRQDQLGFRPEREYSFLAVVSGLVIDQLGEPDILAAAVDHVAGELQQFAGACAGQQLQVDQVASSLGDNRLHLVDGTLRDRLARVVILRLGAPGQKWRNRFKPLQDGRFRQFVLDSMSKNLPDSANGFVDVLSTPAAIDHLRPDGFQRQRSKILRRDHPVEFAKRADGRFEAIVLGSRLATLRVVRLGVPKERQAQFSDTRAGISFLVIGRVCWPSPSPRQRVKWNAARQAGDELSVADAALVAAVLAEIVIPSVDATAGLPGGSVEQVTRQLFLGQRTSETCDGHAVPFQKVVVLPLIFKVFCRTADHQQVT